MFMMYSRVGTQHHSEVPATQGRLEFVNELCGDVMLWGRLRYQREVRVA